jgi:pentatricopeptide repeat protein
MLQDGVKADIAAHNAVLFSWRNNLDRMENIFQKMVRDFLTCSYRDPSHPARRKNGQLKPPAIRPNTNSLSIVLSAQAQANAPDRAENLLSWILTDPSVRGLIEPNVVCLSSVLNAWARVNVPERAEYLLRQIQREGYEVNAETYTTVLRGWAKQGNVKRAEAL